MKKIKKHIKEFALLMSISVLFVSCYNDESGNVAMPLKRQANLSGEEIFKSVIFADGKLVTDIPALQEISMVGSLNGDELAHYRDIENQAIEFLKSTNPDYFKNLELKFNTADPEIISSTIYKIVLDLTPFVNSQLAIQGLSIDSLTQAINRDENGKIDMVKTENQMRQMCCIFVLGPVLVAAAVVFIWVVAISAVVSVGNTLTGPSGSLTLEAISIQIANSLK